jgi:transposase-like protein
MAKAKRRVARYSDEFRNAALARLVNERPFEIAKDLGIVPTMLKRWKDERDNPKERKIRYFPDEFKRAAVARVLAGESQSKVAAEIAVGSSVLSGWVRNKQFSGKAPTHLRPKPPAPPQKRSHKKNYYVKVADRIAQAKTPENGVNLIRKVHACIGLLRGVRAKCDNQDPVHLTALLVLATLEGKM